MKPAILYLAYDRPEYTKESFESILKYTTYPYFLYVWDNGSSYKNRKYFSEVLFKDVDCEKIFAKKNLGLVAPMNWMMKLAYEEGCDLFCHIANDIVVPPKWLEGIVEAIEKVPDLGPTGLSLEHKNFPIVDINGVELEEIEHNGCIGGMHFCISKKLFEAAGYFRYEYFYGQQDMTYTLQARCLGFKPMYIPKLYYPGTHLGVMNIYDIDKKGYNKEIDREEKYIEYHNKMKDIIKTSGAVGNYMRRNYIKVYEMYKCGKIDEKFFKNYFRNTRQVQNVPYDDNYIFKDLTNIKWQRDPSFLDFK